MKLFAVALLALVPCLAAPDVDKGKALGSPNAPITMEIFSDYTCPHCKMLHEVILPMFIRDFVRPQKLFIVMRDFPLTGPGHQFSREAATYATAAARIGKFQEVSDTLFKNQANWAINGKVWDTVAAVLSPADQKKVELLAKDPGVVSEVQQELDEGMSSGVNQTPTMIVTAKGKRYPLSGVDPSNYQLFKKFLDDLLKQ